MSRVADLPIYAQRDNEVTGKLYNLWRRAKLHFKIPVRLELPGCPGIVMILEEHEWVCADELQNDLPILAWVEFEDKGRDVLHAPVKCKLNYYHFAASKLHAIALEKMEEDLDQMLHDD
ncbi:MAG: hypothetical protein OEM38_06540 [Gammaproteobacteria bacterium]|nr:hypothetical protein [Gammaproteobacteria bacterium]